MRTIRKRVPITSDECGHTDHPKAPGLWIGWHARRATCPFCDGEGYYEPEDDVREDFRVCCHLVASEGDVAIFEGPVEDGGGSLFEFGKNLIRLSVEGE